MYCINCGSENKETSKFCLTCGSKLISPNDLIERNVFYQLFDYFLSFTIEKQRFVLGVYFIWIFIHFSILCVFSYQIEASNQFWPFIGDNYQIYEKPINSYGFSEFFFYCLSPFFIYLIITSFKTKIK
jgi:uncharacterized membrane protein YvbJ